MVASGRQDAEEEQEEMESVQEQYQIFIEFHLKFWKITLFESKVWYFHNSKTKDDLAC